MKKILFMCINMNVGGTEKALISMINEIPKNEYEITILMLDEYGEFLELIPKWVKVQHIKDFYKIQPILNKPPLQVVKEYLKRGELIKSFNIGIIHFFCKLLGERSLYFKYVLKDYLCIDKEYDIAVAYAGPMDFITYYVLNKIRAQKKIQWIHFDITKIGLNFKFANKNYNKFDKIFIVSEEARNKLVKKIPSLRDKTEVFYNIISSKNIKDLAKKDRGFEDDFDGIRILTVGRLAKVKGQDITIPVLAKLKKNGYNLRWYCIGDGGARKEYEEMIKKFKLQDEYILLGTKKNPYSYMDKCDIYVQPSRHEGYCITLGEARCFNNPIVATNFTGANEQIKNEFNGLVCEISEEEIYKSVKRLLDDKDLYEQIRNNLSNEAVDSTKEIGKLEKLIYL